MNERRSAAGDCARSSIITVVNRTDTPLRLSKQTLTKGSWCSGHTAPEDIEPRSEVCFSACSESVFGIPRGGTEGSVVSLPLKAAIYHVNVCVC
jgi:hypothetical protein